MAILTIPGTDDKHNALDLENKLVNFFIIIIPNIFSPFQ